MGFDGFPERRWDPHLSLATTIEMLQVLKHLYQREQLNFTAGLLAKEEDYTIEGPVTESAILELLKAGKEAELHDLHTNWAIESD
jgi:hypothetical protein